MSLQNQLTLFTNIFQTYRHIATSRLGSFVKGGYIGPDVGTAVSHNKILACKKAVSEAIERRAIMLGGKEIHGYVETWELIGKQKSKLPVCFTTYSDKFPHYIDTTGSASYPDSQKAVFYAIKELLEKNALLLFWYLKNGYRIDSSLFNIMNNAYYRLLSRKYEVSIFLCTYFSPLKVVFTLIYSDDSYPMGGVGSSLNFKEAIIKSLEETYLLKCLELINDDIKIFPKSNKGSEEDKLSCVRYVEELSTLDTYKYTEKDDGPTNEKGDLRLLFNCIPEWVADLHLIFLPQLMFPALKCVKVFSRDLLNCLPSKKTINPDIKICKKFGLNTEKLEQVVDCPIL